MGLPSLTAYWVAIRPPQRKSILISTRPLAQAVNSIGATIDAAMRGDSDSRKVVPLLNKRGWLNSALWKRCWPYGFVSPALSSRV